MKIRFYEIVVNNRPLCDKGALVYLGVVTTVSAVCTLFHWGFGLLLLPLVCLLINELVKRI